MRPIGDEIRVLVADAQPLFAEALVEALSCWRDLVLVAERPDDPRAVIAAAEAHMPDVVVLDFWLDGASLTETIRVRLPRCKVVLLSDLTGVPQIQKALRAGAVAFLPRGVMVDEVVHAIRRAHAGDSLAFGDELAGLFGRLQQRGEEVAKRVLWVDTFTTREGEVLDLLMLGHPVEEVARRLAIGVGTTRGHVHRILTKTGARSAVEAVAIARHYGYLKP